MRRPRTSSSLAVLALAALIAPGCTPSCEDVCEKLVACENEGTERMSAPECEESCRDQQSLYAEWDDTQLRDAFEAEMTCLGDATCEEIADGVCYDEEVWAF